MRRPVCSKIIGDTRDSYDMHMRHHPANERVNLQPRPPEPPRCIATQYTIDRIVGDNAKKHRRGKQGRYRLSGSAGETG